MGKPSPRDVAQALLRRRRTKTVFALKHKDGRFYFDFVDFLARASLDELYIFPDKGMAMHARVREPGSKIVTVKLTIDIEEIENGNP